MSDTGTSRFADASPARRLRVSIARRTHEPSSRELPVGGETATCVVVPVGGGEEQTCAVPQGVIGLWRTAAVGVQLDDISDVADPAAFDTGR